MKLFLILIIGLLSFNSFAQERELLTGRVSKNDSLLENVHARNLSTGKSSITNQHGQFQLSSKTGDTLLFSHVGLNDYIKILREKDLQTGEITIRMTEVTNELKEVSVNSESEINAVSLGIIPKKIEKPTVNERRLKTAGDFKWIHLLGILGGNLQIDPILNALNGRTKQLKRNIEVEKKLHNIGVLEGYTAYMELDMGLAKEDIRKLISLAVEEENIQPVIDSKNADRVKFFLLDTWLKYKE